MSILSIISVILIGIGVLFLALIIPGNPYTNITQVQEITVSMWESIKALAPGLGLILAGLILLLISSLNWNFNWREKDGGEYK